MKKCERLETCPFFNDIMSNMPAESENIKQQYCFDHFETCARKLVADKFGAEQVPDDMFPYDNYRAIEFINYMTDKENKKVK